MPRDAVGVIGFVVISEWQDYPAQSNNVSLVLGERTSLFECLCCAVGSPHLYGERSDGTKRKTK